MARYTDAQKNEAVRLYVEGQTLADVADKCGCSAGSVRRWLRAAGHTPRPRVRVSRYTDWDKRSAVDRYVAGEPSSRIAADLGCCAVMVRGWCRAAGVTLRSRGPRHSQRSRGVKMYRDGATAAEVGREVGVTQQTVLRWCRAAGVPIRNRPRYSAEVRAEAAARYAAGETPAEIAADLGCSSDTVRRWQRAVGVPPQKRVSTAADRARAVEMVRQGATQREAGEATGWSQAAVAAWCAAAGIRRKRRAKTPTATPATPPKPKAPRRALPPFALAAALQDLERGRSVDSVAASLGVSVEQVREIIDGARQ